MNSAIQPATPDHPLWTGDDPALPRDPDFDGPPFLRLPILARSASLLSLLLQESSVDLELTSAVVALDPGLAFTTLQLANCEGRDGDEALWQFPLALVAGGQRRLLQAVNRAPKIEAYSSTKTRARLGQLWMRAIVRASVAFDLSKQMGGANSRQAFLAALLFELPGLVELAFPSSAEAQLGLQATARASLPLEITTAIGHARDHIHPHTGADSDLHLHSHSCPNSEDSPQTSLGASLLLAELLLRSTLHGPLPSPGSWVGLTSNPAWQCWEETSMEQRHRRLDRCWQLARWAAANAPEMNPWEFTARLERSKGWE